MGGCVRTPLAGKSDHLVEVSWWSSMGGDDVGSTFGWTCGGRYSERGDVGLDEMDG